MPTYTWDAAFEADPADSDELKYGAQEIRKLKVALSERLEIEHAFKASGLHSPGKVSCLYEGNTAQIANLTGMSEGAMAYDTTLGVLQRYSGAAWVAKSSNVATIGASLWPVGSLFLSVVSTNPATLLGFGTWAAFGAGRTLIGLGGSYSVVKATGGNATHILAANEIPPHVHTISGIANEMVTTGTDAWGPAGSSNTGDGSAGGLLGEAHNNLPPYIVVYMWERTA